MGRDGSVRAAEGGQCLGQDPRINALLKDRSRIGHCGGGLFVLAHGPKHLRLAEHRMGHLDGLPEDLRKGHAMLDQW